MYFRRGDIQKVKKHIRQHAKDIGLLIFKDYVTIFLNELKDITKNKKYNEGEQIDPSDMQKLYPWIELAIKKYTGAVIVDAKNPKEPMESIADPTDHLLTITDYYFALAQEELGCPNMPLFLFNEKIQKLVERCALNIDNAFPKYNYSVKAEFNSQRGKNANELQGRFNDHREAIEKKNNTAKHMGELICEYQALKARQKNHIGLWRAFHRGENKARNALLKSMENTITSTINKVFPKGMYSDVNSLDPSEIARKLADARIRGNVAVAVSYRTETKTEEIFGCPEGGSIKDAQMNKSNEFIGKEPMSNYKSFMDDVVENNSSIVEPPKEEKKISKDNIISQDDSSFNLLD